MVNGDQDKPAAAIESLQGRELEAQYLAYCECFNRGEYFEAHKVLEPLWLSQRGGPKEGCYKGLIQLAGAFVHLQAERLAPAVALLKLSRANLARCPVDQGGLGVDRIQQEIDRWLAGLEAEVAKNPLSAHAAPALRLK
jgi:uncharacterized protein